MRSEGESVETVSALWCSIRICLCVPVSVHAQMQSGSVGESVVHFCAYTYTYTIQLKQEIYRYVQGVHRCRMYEIVIHCLLSTTWTLASLPKTSRKSSKMLCL